MCLLGSEGYMRINLDFYFKTYPSFLSTFGAALGQRLPFLEET